jgi:hypothetical protein
MYGVIDFSRIDTRPGGFGPFAPPVGWQGDYRQYLQTTFRWRHRRATTDAVVGRILVRNLTARRPVSRTACRRGTEFAFPCGHRSAATNAADHPGLGRFFIPRGVYRSPTGTVPSRFSLEAPCTTNSHPSRTGSHRARDRQQALPPVPPLQHWQPDSGGHPAPSKVSAPVAHRELQPLEGAGPLGAARDRKPCRCGCRSRSNGGTSQFLTSPATPKRYFTRFKCATLVQPGADRRRGLHRARRIAAVGCRSGFGRAGHHAEHFDYLDGNVQGYAVKRRIAVSQLADYPHKTRFHEMAHVVLGHTLAAIAMTRPSTPRSLQEVEAEGVAFLLCSILDLPGQDESRAYIQSWLEGGQLPEKSAQRIFKRQPEDPRSRQAQGRPAVTQ